MEGCGCSKGSSRHNVAEDSTFWDTKQSRMFCLTMNTKAFVFLEIWITLYQSTSQEIRKDLDVWCSHSNAVNIVAD
jgi:hypothetical protein